MYQQLKLENSHLTFIFC